MVTGQMVETMTWELCIRWEPVRLEAPCFYKENPLTAWTEAGKEVFKLRKAGHEVDFEPGRDFHPVTKLPQDGYVYIVGPSISGPHAERMRSFRASWIL